MEHSNKRKLANTFLNLGHQMEMDGLTLREAKEIFLSEITDHEWVNVVSKIRRKADFYDYAQSLSDEISSEIKTANKNRKVKHTITTAIGNNSLCTELVNISQNTTLSSLQRVWDYKALEQANNTLILSDNTLYILVSNTSDTGLHASELYFCQRVANEAWIYLKETNLDIVKAALNVEGVVL